MPPVSFATVHHVQWAGGKYVWKVTADDLDKVGAHTLVKLRPANSSLLGFILQDGDEIKKWRAERKTVSNLPGYRELMQLRNEAQASELSEDVCEPEPKNHCTLFGKAATHKQSQRHSSKADLALTLLDVKFEADGSEVVVKMKRPCAARDTLHIWFSEDAVASVAGYLRNRGFNALDIYENRCPAQPRGVWMRKLPSGLHKYLVKNAETGKLKVVGSVEHAIAVMSSDHMSAVVDGDAELEETEGLLE